MNETDDIRAYYVYDDAHDTDDDTDDDDIDDTDVVFLDEPHEDIEEVWTPIRVDGIPWNSEISNVGNIRDSDTHDLRPLSKMTNGYRRITLYHDGVIKKTYRVHRLVAFEFIPNNDPTKARWINHKNYNRSDNRVSNLEWVTSVHNARHSYLREDRKLTYKPILRYNLTEPISVKRYESIQAAREDGFGVLIYDCLKGRTENAYGHWWVYENPQVNSVPRSELDMTIFKEVRGHPKFLISREGRIYNQERESFLSPRIDKETPLVRTVSLDTKNYQVHGLVMSHFSDEDPTGKIVARKPGKGAQ